MRRELGWVVVVRLSRVKFRRFFIGPAVIAVLLYYSNGGYLRLTEIDRHLKKKKVFSKGIYSHSIYSPVQ